MFSVVTIFVAIIIITQMSCYQIKEENPMWSWEELSATSDPGQTLTISEELPITLNTDQWLC